ncbi:exodeoxyribonuclease VII large subunit [Methanomicrobium sp. W14]|uniref:exodeoxyribonuclease VII large subunit n=1 Tax=Methanomicrobium sp. W14 TaxID=2817839 RepID=UPI001AE66685|nr:exodeoxyribonuclease VII large subunit [Methanomicrobium sp. W14]MBP2132852.1 exodeoxyribonuclease VII large subunit [Methanomicrobium sp. W14]
MDWFGTGEDNGKDPVKSVYEVSSRISRLLDDESLKGIWVEGEITNFHRHVSGHFYFSVAEERNSKTYVLNCAMWRSSAREISYIPRNGDRVKIYGSVEVYEPHGKYQFIARDMVVCGEGDKHILLQKWKEEFLTLGIFDESRKKPLPKYPEKIGVVTALGGAARRDIENVISRRYPVEIVLSPAAVQGDNAHTEIAEAIRRIDGMVDVIIVGRGGGSFEDLFEFNHPDVVVAVYECRTPVVSAVGHEIDFTLCDFAADVRAPTPSAAAEIVVPDMSELLRELTQYRHSLLKGLEEKIEKENQNLENCRLHLHPRRLSKLINTEYERLDDLHSRILKCIDHRVGKEDYELKVLRKNLELLNPFSPLDKGFCMLRSGETLIKSASELKEGQHVSMVMKDGSAKAEILEVCNEKEL